MRPLSSTRAPAVFPAWAAAALCAVAIAGCPGPGTGPDGGDAGTVEFGETLGLPACDTATAAAHPDQRCYTFRAVAGVSMGGGTSARLGFTYPELFDVVGVMGTPFADNEFFWGMAEHNHLTGFCPLEQLEQVMAEQGPEELNNPDNPDVWCGRHDSWDYSVPEDEQAAFPPATPGVFPAVEGSQCWMFRSDYNHWYRGPDTGRGGNFKRNSLFDIFHDIAAAYGNSLYYNPDAPYFPPGVPSTWHVTPGRGDEAAALCANPVVLQGFFNREYNPEGTYPVITYCDGASGDSGDYTPGDPQQFSKVVEFALAVDLNGNGIRDYGEPVVVNNRERYLDVGPDGLADEDEPGYDPETNPDPSGDNWDPVLNAFGAEKNWRWDEGEPYDDDGLDGVPATLDYGEDNGVYDLSPTLARTFARSPSRLFLGLDDAQVDRLDVWMDAGIRDFINSAQMTNALYGALASRIENSKIFNDFDELPGADDPSEFDFYDADYSTDAMGRVAYLRYGDTSICPGTNVSGDGNHVGIGDVVDRIYTMFGFLSERMPAEGRRRSFGGDIADLYSPNGAPIDFAFMSSFDSEVLGRQVDYGVLLPPDYYFPEAIEEGRSYPVLYFFHGQGMSASDMVAAGLLMWPSMKESARSDRVASGETDLQRAIIIWVDGECPDGTCWTGNFYADFEGLPSDDKRFEGAFVELMQHVEATYRVKKPALFPR